MTADDASAIEDDDSPLRTDDPLIEGVSTFVLGDVLGSKNGPQKNGKNRVSLVDKRT